jgi:cytochrome b6
MLWDERAFAAVRVATGGAGQLPLIGKYIQIFLRGGIDVTGDTLLRFSAFHMAILPIVTLLVMGLHILLVQFHGMSVPVSLENKPLKQEPFFPNVLYKDLMIWLVVLGVVVTLAALAPPEIGLKADPLAAPPENVKPEWYFLCVMQVLKLFPGDILGFNGEMIAITIISLGIAFLFFLPLSTENLRGGKNLHCLRPLAYSIFCFL